MNTIKAPENIEGAKEIYINHFNIEHLVFPENRSYVLIIYIIHGSGDALIGDTSYRCSMRDTFLVSSATKAEFISDTGASSAELDAFCVLFEPDFLRGEQKTYENEFDFFTEHFGGDGDGHILSRDSQQLEIRDYLIKMIYEFYENAPARESYLYGMLLSLIPVILRRFGTLRETFCKNKLVDDAIRFIHNCIYSRLKPHDIAEKCFVTTEHLARVFKRETGMTMTEYINKTRIDEIKDLLENTDCHVEDIPSKFDMDIKYTRKLFKKHTGMSMSEYRAEHHYR